MTDVREASLIARQEIRRNLQSKKGIAMFALFFFGGAVPPLLQLVFQRIQINVGSVANSPDDSNRELRRMLLEKAYGAEGADYLIECPSVLFFLLKGALLVLPLLVLFVAYDQLVGEIQHGTIRYLLGRARRSSIVVGKALGVWAVFAVLVLVLDLTVGLATLSRSDAAPRVVLLWGARIWLFSVAKAAAFVGLTALVSARCRTPTVALVTGAAVFFALALTQPILGDFKATAALTWLLPATYEDLMLSPDPIRAFEGVVLFVLWGTACVVAAATVVRRRDL